MTTLCLVVLSGACRPELPDGLFVCAADDQCPEQFACLQSGGAGHCVRGVRHENPLQETDAGSEPARPDMSTVQRLPDSGTEVADNTGKDAGIEPAVDASPGSAGPQPTPDAGMMSAEVAPAPECLGDGDCSAASACALPRCRDGRCSSEPVPKGTPLSAAEQVRGDCQQLVCDGKGEVAQQTQPDDLPAGDGNVCQMLSCVDGQADRSNRPDGESCNGAGQCQGGACSVCQGGSDCTKPSDCTLHQTQCVDGKPQCTDTGMPLDGKTCEVGRVCSAKQCVSCVVGAACGDSAPCQRSRITSCASGPACTSEPSSGTSCGRDTAGRERVCAAGSCVYSCPTTACGDAASCQAGRWDCSDPARPPTCNASPVADGTACGDDRTCRAGTCSRSVLVNGDFSQGFRGWELTGDAANFLIGADANHFNRRFISTWITAADGNGDRAKGSVSQRFTAPADALALRFLVSGGHAHVRLRDDAGSVLQDVTGLDSNELRVPVSWDLTAHRGKRLIVSIDDELDASGWSFVAALGFDVIRAVEAPLRNSQFSSGLDHWEMSGDGRYFNVWDDHNYWRTIADNMLEAVPAYGTRRSVGSFVYDTNAPRQSDAAIGTVSQRFEVPADAVAIRFNIHGGRFGRVELREGGTPLYMIAGADDNAVKIPVSWDLTGHRGKTLELAIIDDRGDTGWSFISSTGFDVITSYNGP